LRRVGEEGRREKIETVDGKDRLRTKVQRRSVLTRDRYRRTHSRQRRLMERLLSDRRVELAEASGRLHPSGRH
jgi:hypothetical protein